MKMYADPAKIPSNIKYHRPFLKIEPRQKELFAFLLPLVITAARKAMRATERKHIEPRYRLRKTGKHFS